MQYEFNIVCDFREIQTFSETINLNKNEKITTTLVYVS